ncbi:MAG: holo-ACP synthase [Desulfovibrio sp.]|jgi:holo-[acyl-carrier protein] synthase|nr:holo-ACP synthase [Desulfovibrio sp.]
MIAGIGADIVEIRRVGRSCERFGQRFLKKIFTTAELDALAGCRVSTLAGRFAAKEAAVKALGTGFAKGIGPLQIEIFSDSLGAPMLSFSGRAAERLRSIGVIRSLLSISHDRDTAVAFVVLEGQ